MKIETIKKLHDTLQIVGSTLDPGIPDQISEISLQSGKNRYLPKIGYRNQSDEMVYTIQFPGTQLKGGLQQILAVLADELGKYDSVSIVFNAGIDRTRVEADERGVRIKKEQNVPAADMYGETGVHIEHGISTNRDYFVKISQASGLLREIGVLDEKMKVRNDMIRKYNQIDRFVEFADAVIKKIAAGDPKRRRMAGASGVSAASEGDGAAGRGTVNILDCACGKSYLSFVLYFYIREVLGLECSVTGLDISEAVIEASRRTAANLGYTGMKFMTADLRTYRHQGAPLSLCISLHACDVATDYAIYTGIVNKAGAIMCVPCCHKELLTSGYKVEELSRSIFRSGIFKARFSDLMTDAIRVLTLEDYGYDVSATEYISPLDSPKNLLLSAVYTGRRSKASGDERQMLGDRYGMKITLE
ncbi:MAG: class I SAM-dependent methyltransferase, partial [Saccharofermentanales bacterium]